MENNAPEIEVPQEFPPTLGERRMRIQFNPSGNELVERAKRQAADLIDLAQALRADIVADGSDLTPGQFQERYGETLLLISRSQTAAEEAGMWLVKAITA